MSQLAKRNKKEEKKYYPCEIIRSTSYTKGQNAQNNMGISHERKIIDMHHVLK
jgi:hypothetical protein